MRVSRIPGTNLALVAVLCAGVGAAGCGGSGAPDGTGASYTTAPSVRFDKGGTQDHFNEKFEFTDVDLTEAGGPADATIRAGSKRNNNSQDTNCDYFTSADAYLGSFDTQGFSSDDPDVVLSFCVDHFGDRSGA